MSRSPAVGATATLEAIKVKVENLVRDETVLVFGKSWCVLCMHIKSIFTELGVPYHEVELDTMDTGESSLWQQALSSRTGQEAVPYVFIRGQFITGGWEGTLKLYRASRLLAMIKGEEVGDTGDSLDAEDLPTYDYGLIVIGGGSGGLSASKAAGKLGMKVAVCDFVDPTPIGTSWGLGGTCVNVGCIPKKLMHQAALFGQGMSDAASFGWDMNTLDPPTHIWSTLVDNVQNYIRSLNWGHRVALRDASVTYLNEKASFVDQHTIQTTNNKGETQNLTADKFIVAVGGRPRYPEIPGAKELAITSDDIFSLSYHPGKVLCVGASYIALECAGLLAGLGIETEVMGIPTENLIRKDEN